DRRCQTPSMGTVDAFVHATTRRNEEIPAQAFEGARHLRWQAFRRCQTPSMRDADADTFDAPSKPSMGRAGGLFLVVAQRGEDVEVLERRRVARRLTARGHVPE